jgi:hypothetical protein
MKKYTKEQILIAGEIGEVSMIDVRYIVSLLDEAVVLERERKLLKHNVGGELTATNKCKRNYETLIHKIPLL